MSDTPKHARAVLMRGYGPPSVLTYAEVSLSPLKADEVRVRSIASAINHTDLEIRAGNWPIRAADPFPYTPGVEVVGEIQATGQDVHGLRPGDRVITMMQGLGGVRAERPGGYAEYVDVAAAAVALLPAGIDPYDMAALGLVGVTAYEGLKRIGSLASKRILVTGAAGGIGSAAVAIARAQGALVTGLISRPEQEGAVRALGAVAAVICPKDSPTALEAASFDGVIDAVGGPLFARCVEALRPGGVLCLVGAVAGGDVKFDAWQLIRPVTLTGYSSETLDGQALRDDVSTLARWLIDGSVRSPARAILPLAEAARAHELLESRELTGRVLLSPSE
jgi:NADPH:quinone reductase